MKVRILSGSRAGQIEDQDQVVAESNIATGFAEPVPEEREHEGGDEHREDERHEDDSGTRHEPKPKKVAKKR